MDGKHQQSSSRGSEYVHESDPGEVRSGAQNAASQPSPGPGEGLLEAVVQQTAWTRDDLARMDRAELDGLVATARQLEQSSADRATVARELTRTLIAIRFPALAQDGQRLSDVVAKVAEDLVDSPAAAERLERLWRLLLQVEPT